MSKSGRSLMIALLSVSVFAANVAEAAGLGGGRSTGMQRSQITRSAPVSPAQQIAPQQPTQQPGQQPQRSGPGWGGVAAGVAAGAETGYLASKMMEPNAAGASSMAQAAPAEQPGGGIPWGWILALGALAFFGARMLTRRRAQQASAAGLSPAGMPAMGQPDGER